MTLQSPTPNHYRTLTFESTDLRGKSFPGVWRDANFRHVTTGVSPILHILRQTSALFLAFLAGFITAYAGATLGFFFQDPSPNFWLLRLAIGLLLLLFFLITLRHGLTAALGSLSLFTVFLVVITVALADKDIAGLAALSPLVIGGAIAGSVGVAVAIALIQSQPLPLACSTLGLMIGSAFGLLDPTPSKVLWLLVLSLPVITFGSYLGHCTLQRDSRYDILQAVAIYLSTWQSTSFRESDLTAADFSYATLRHTDFSNATLTLTRWHNAIFDQSNLQGTYLNDPIIRKLLTSLDGQGKNFDRLDLRGVNLDNANLVGASFVGSDLSSATLKGANLSKAKLVQTQLYEADLTGAILTGAYIENWGISPETKLDSIQCDEIFLRFPTTDNPDPYRKPDNRDETFQSNDFTDFIAPIINTLKAYRQQTLAPITTVSTPAKTLDLYHQEGIDPTAAAIALYELTTQTPQSNIQVISIEGVEQKIRIQASIDPLADPSNLNTQYFFRYNKLAIKSSPTLQAILDDIATQHTQVRALADRIAAASGSPSPGSYMSFSPDLDSSPRRSALQRKRDRLENAINQENQSLDTLEKELQAAHNQRTTEMDEVNRSRLKGRIQKLENDLESGEAKLLELEKQLSNLEQ